MSALFMSATGGAMARKSAPRLKISGRVDDIRGPASPLAAQRIDPQQTPATHVRRDFADDSRR
jgi:hypothetical protein